jgi:Xaa-Pro aminopeptidase
MLLNKARAYDVMDKYGLDGLLATSQINIFYLTDFWGALMNMRRSFFNYAVLPRDENAPAALVMTAVELSRLIELPTWVPNVVTYSHPALMASRDYDTGTEEPDAGAVFSWPVRNEDKLPPKEQKWRAMGAEHAEKTMATPSYALRRALRDAGLEKGTIGTDDPRPVAWMNALGLEDLKGVEATNIFREIRMVKSDAEIAIIREAARINEDAINAGIKAMHKGVTWADVELAYGQEMARQGGRAVYITAGPGGMSHDEAPVGEPIMFDALGEYGRYHGDIGRTAIIGEPTAEIVKRNKAMSVGWQAAFDTIKPGVTGREMTEKVLSVIEREGFPGFFIATPHSVGLEHTDHPIPIGLELPGSHGDLVFMENMVINVDLPYHELGFGGMHLEDMIRVTKDGCEPLTTMETDLIVIPE